jgi:hypothetical protein
MRAAIINEASLVTNVIEVSDDRLDVLPGLIEGTGAAIGDTWDGQQFLKPPPQVPDLAAAKSALVLGIDANVDAIYRAVVGDRSDEYQAAREQALTYQQGGYTGTAPACVASWAQAKGWSAQQAADDILATATAWETLRDNIRAARLLAKELARTASDASALQTVATDWASTLAQLRVAAGL